MKACMREISKWCNEVSREPNQEVAEEVNNAATKVFFFFFFFVLNVSVWMPRKSEKMKMKKNPRFMSFCLEKMRISIRSVGEK